MKRVKKQFMMTDFLYGNSKLTQYGQRKEKITKNKINTRVELEDGEFTEEK